MGIFDRFYHSTVYRWRDQQVNRMRWHVQDHKTADYRCISISPFVRPIGINLDDSNRILISDIDSHRVMRFSDTLAFDGWLGVSKDNPERAPGHWRFDAPRAIRGDGPGAFARPHGIEFDGEGNIFVTELENRRIQVFNKNGDFLRFVPSYQKGLSPPLVGPATARLEQDGNLYVTDFRGNAIHRFDADDNFVGWYGDDGENGGTVGFHRSGTPVPSSRPCGFLKPHVARVDKQGYLVVADTWNHRISRLDPSGRFAGWIGADAYGNPALAWRLNGAAAEASVPGGFSAPVAIDFDDHANILVAEFGNHRIQLFTPDGAYIGWIGARKRGGVAGPWSTKGLSCSSSSPGGFRNPYDIAFRRGKLYVADTENGRVQIISLPDPTNWI